MDKKYDNGNKNNDRTNRWTVSQRKQTDIHTNKVTYKQTDRQTDRQTDKQKNKQHTQTDKKTNGVTDSTHRQECSHPSMRSYIQLDNEQVSSSLNNKKQK